MSEHSQEQADSQLCNSKQQKLDKQQKKLKAFSEELKEIATQILRDIMHE